MAVHVGHWTGLEAWNLREGNDANSGRTKELRRKGQEPEWFLDVFLVEVNGATSGARSS